MIGCTLRMGCDRPISCTGKFLGLSPRMTPPNTRYGYQKHKWSEMYQNSFKHPNK